MTCKHPDGCARPVKAYGWCKAHYARLVKTGDVGGVTIAARRPLGRRCAVENCDRVVVNGSANDMCDMHYQRWRKHGSPHVVKRGGHRLKGAESPSWTGDQATYGAVHLRLAAQRGSARAHACADCSGPARHWSYDYTDPNERQAPEGSYSVDLSHYKPRCVRCHSAHDRAQALLTGERP